MTVPDVVALRQLAARLLTQQAGPGADPAALAATAGRMYDELARVLSPLIGRGGIDALSARAMHLAQQEYAWLAKASDSEHGEGAFARISSSLEQQQDPALVTEAAATVLARFGGLLAAL